MRRPTLVAAILAFVRHIPRKTGLQVCRKIGVVCYYCMPERRRVIAANLDIAFGNTKDRAEKVHIAKACFANLFAMVFDLLRFPQMERPCQDAALTIVGEEHLRQALAHGRGVVAVSAHYGNFVLLLSAMAQRGYPLFVVTRHFRNALAEDLYNGFLANFGVRVFPRERAVVHILRALREGAVVGYVMDQNMQRDNGLFVDFFGLPACTLKGLGTLAGRYGSPILPVHIVSEEDGRHTIHIEEPIMVEAGEGGKALEYQLTQQATARIEGWIRQRPEQWFWLHRRWKTRPAGEGRIYPPKHGLRVWIKRIRRTRRSHA